MPRSTSLASSVTEPAASPARRWLRRLAIVLGVLVVLLVGGVGILYAVTFGGTGAIEDGERIGGFATAVKDGFVSFHILETSDGKVVLIDGGNEPATLEQALHDRGLTTDDVLAAFLTHGHRDHVAGLAALPDSVPIYGFEADAPLVDGSRSSGSPVGKLVSPSPTGVALTRPLLDGERVRLGGLAIQAFHIPGHTGGSAAFLSRGVLFLGDSGDAQQDGGMSAAKWPFSEDTAENRRSLASLARRLEAQRAEVRALVFSHSGTLKRGLAPLKELARTP